MNKNPGGMLGIDGTNALKLEVPQLADSGESKDLQTLSGELSRTFQTSLLIWFKKPANKRNLGILLLVINRVQKAAKFKRVALLWWLAGGLVEALIEDGLVADSSLKDLLTQLERQLNYLAKNGEQVGDVAVPEKLLKALLAQINKAESRGEAVVAIRQAAADSTLVPATDHVKKGTKSDVKFTLLGAVQSAITSDINKIVRAIEGISSADTNFLTGQKAVSEHTLRLAKVLDMAGLCLCADTLRDQLAISEQTGKKGSERYMPLIGALRYLKTTIDKLLQGEISEEPRYKAALGGFQQRYRKVLGVVVEQVYLEIGKIKAALERFSQYGFDHRLLEEIPFLFGRVTDGLQAVAMDRAAEVATHLSDYVEVRFLGEKAVPDDQVLVALSQALSGIEYYLHASDAGQPHVDQLLDVVDEILEELPFSKQVEKTMVLDLAQIRAAMPTGRSELEIDHAIESGLAGESDLEPSSDPVINSLLEQREAITRPGFLEKNSIEPYLGNLSELNVSSIHDGDLTAIIEGVFPDKRDGQ